MKQGYAYGMIQYQFIMSKVLFTLFLRFSYSSVQLQVFIGSHYIACQGSFECCLHKVGRKQKPKQRPHRQLQKLKHKMVKKLAKQSGTNELQKNTQTGGIEDIHLVEKISETLKSLLLYHLEISRRKKASAMEIFFTCIFLDIGFSTGVLNNPWKFHMPFLNTPGNSVSSTLLFGYFLEQTNEWFQQLVAINQKQYYRLLDTLPYSLINSTN